MYCLDKPGVHQTGSNATFEHADEVHAVAFSPDASAFLVGGDGERRFWDGACAGLRGCSAVYAIFR